MLASSGPRHKPLIVAGCHRTVASYILTFSILRTKYLNDDFGCLYTVGAIKKENLVFVNFSAQDASILKISVPIIK